MEIVAPLFEKPRIQPVPAEIYKPRFWYELHQAYPILNELKEIRDCYSWSGKAMEVLRRERLEGIFQYLSIQQMEEDGWLHETTGVWAHIALVRPEGDTFFIADGTAGQFDQDYANGFYGYLDQAPELLQKIYSF
jgi:hypothetical protein